MRVLLCILAVALCGCVQTDWKSYYGSQSGWPIGSGAFAREVNGMPVFSGPPPREYEVLGQIVTSFAGNPIEGQMIGPAVNRAKRKGADALILTNSARDYLASISSGGFHSRSSWNASGGATIWPASNTVTATASGDGYQSGSAYGVTAPVYQHTREFIAIRWRE